MVETFLHTPVLLDEVVTGLQLKPGQTVLDATVGTGGHAEAILSRILPGGELYGLDLDQSALDTASKRLSKFKPNVHLIRSSYRDAVAVLAETNVAQADRILLDLGISSLELEESGRGFSFQRAGEPLDMRFDAAADTATAAELLATNSEEDLATILSEYGEEPLAKAIAGAIVTERRSRPIERVGDLLPIILGAYGRRWSTRSEKHPATRTFQALRIAVNNELETLTQALPDLIRLLAPSGRIAVISFHSLEDRIVKELFREEARDCICPPEIPVCRCNHKATIKILTKHVIVPTQQEQTHNPRSRSAKLRIAERLPT